MDLALALAPALLKFGESIYWMQATSAEVEYIKNEKGLYSWEIGGS